jgi:branched-chain amino acid aminotransferase
LLLVEQGVSMNTNEVRYAWMNGQFIPWDEAKVHITSSCVIEGSSVFEGIRAYWNPSQEQLYLFKTNEHLERLYQSAKMMHMAPQFSRAELESVCLELMDRNGYREDVHIRPAIYFGEGQGMFCYTPDKIETGVAVTAVPRKSRLGSRSGMHVCISSWKRISDADFPPRIKISANYHNGRLAAVQAASDGYDSAILLDDRGKVAEGPVACVFLIRDGMAITPPITGGILESITRTTVMELLGNELSIPVAEREVDRTELYIAEEAFFCGTAIEIAPILSVDRYALGGGKIGDTTARLEEVYERTVRGENPRYEKALLPAYAPGVLEKRPS